VLYLKRKFLHFLYQKGEFLLTKYHRGCIKTHHFDTINTNIFWEGGSAPPQIPPLGAFGVRPAVVPLSDGLNTHCCKILDPPLIIIKFRENLIFFCRLFNPYVTSSVVGMLIPAASESPALTAAAAAAAAAAIRLTLSA